MPINIEHSLGDNEAIERNFNVLRSLVIDTGGKDISMRFGVATDAWPGGADTTTGVAVAHGLSTTPVVVFTQSTTILAHARPTALTGTTFNINAKTVDGSAPGAGNLAIYWLAIG